MEKNIYFDAMMGLVVGDAVGVPAEFKLRSVLADSPVTDMTGFGTHNVPPGTWSDDSSMALATLDSLREGYDPEDIMLNFVEWLEKAKYTPFGEVFDVGCTCSDAIERYEKTADIKTCGKTDETDNGNGSLMRILPACVYFYFGEQRGEYSEKEAVNAIHEISALTHAHLRSKIACGLYYFLVKETAGGSGSLAERLQTGFDRGFAYYENNGYDPAELAYYDRLRDMDTFARLPEDSIMSTGYVVHSFEAAVWCLVNNGSYRDTVLAAVNLGSDTDTVAAIAGGIAGLYYGYEGIPEEWREQILCRGYIESMCAQMG